MDIASEAPDNKPITDAYLFEAVAACCSDGGRIVYPPAVLELIQDYAPTVNAIPQADRRFFLLELELVTGRCRPPLPEPPLPQAVSTPGKFYCTMFESPQAYTKTLFRVTLGELAYNFQLTRMANKAELPLAKLALMGDKVSSKGCYCTNENVRQIWGIEADYDGAAVNGAAVGFDEVVAKLRAANIAAFVYTTPSHTDAKPHWRALCPASRGLPPGERAKLMDRLNGVLGGGLAAESWVLAQRYYFGIAEDGVTPRTAIIEGDCIDTRPELPATPKPGGSRSSSTKKRQEGKDAADRQPVSVEQLRRMGRAAIVGGTTELHYNDLFVVVLGVLRYPVEGDADRSARIEVARQIWDTNTVSESLTDAKFEYLVNEAADNLRFDEETGKVQGPGAFLHYAKLGRYAEAAAALSRMSFNDLFGDIL